MDPILLNTKVIKAVKEALPTNANIADVLSDILPISREGVYRRIRGEVVFSFHEIYSIAQKLGLSVDYMIKSSSNESAIFELIQQPFQGSEEEIYKTPNKFEQIMGLIMDDTSSKFELSHNLFPQVPSHMFYHLSKYNSFKWIYKNENKKLKPVPYKEVDYPEHIFQLHKKNNIATMGIRQTSYIWDYTIVEMMVREIRYFAEIKLLDKEDVTILKNELHKFLSYVENLTFKGVFSTGNKINIYISGVNSDASYSYIETSKYRICMIGLFDFQYIISTDDVAYNMVKGKIQSLKMASTLITETNENYRLSFFRTQRELVNAL